MIVEYFTTTRQEDIIKAKKSGQVIYPKIFKLETGMDLLSSLKEKA